MLEYFEKLYLCSFMLRYFEKAFCYSVSSILVMLLLILIFHKSNGNSQSITCFEKCSLSWDLHSPPPLQINNATYWVLAHFTLSQSYRLISYILGIEFLYVGGDWSFTLNWETYIIKSWWFNLVVFYGSNSSRFVSQEFYWGCIFWEHWSFMLNHLVFRIFM